MRKRTMRRGMRLILGALLLIILVSFFHSNVAGMLSLSYETEARLYQFGIFWAAVIGGYGAVQSVLGLVLSSTPRDAGVRILPSLFLIVAVISLFFYLLSLYFDPASPPRYQRLRPGESITI